jgi:hypothetical protein
MSELFTRTGKAFTGQPHGEPGKQWHPVQYPCSRCGGRGGSDAWKFTGYTCYRCGGGCLEPVTHERLYTAEALAKLNATAAKKAANKQAKIDAARAVELAALAARQEAFQAAHAETLQWLSQVGYADSASCDDEPRYREGFLGDMLRRAHERAEWSEAQLAAIIKVRDQRREEKAKAAASRHIGTIGERLELIVTVERQSVFYRAPFMRTSYSGRSQEEAVYVTTMRDEHGNALVAMSPNFSEPVGSTILLRATVKDHDDYRGEAQTKLTRAQTRETIKHAPAA